MPGMDLYEHLSRDLAAVCEALDISESLALKVKARNLVPSDRVLLKAMEVFGYPFGFNLTGTLRRANPRWDETHIAVYASHLVCEMEAAR